jgi:hypothetical protein
MSQYIKPISSTLTFCESFSCDNEATIETEVSAGKYGMIILNLCTDCAMKFQ